MVPSHIDSLKANFCYQQNTVEVMVWDIQDWVVKDITAFASVSWIPELYQKAAAMSWGHERGPSGDEPTYQVFEWVALEMDHPAQPAFRLLQPHWRLTELVMGDPESELTNLVAPQVLVYRNHER